MNLWETLKNLKWKEINFNDVIQGCVAAYLTDFTVDPDRIRKISLYRLKTFCTDCHMNNDGWCDNSGNRKIVNIDSKVEVIGCGCSLACKTALLSSHCPAGLWKPVE